MRLISLAPSNTEILFALGLGDQLVACTHFCDWPPVVRSKPKIGGWINTEPEKLADLKPDFILTSYFLPEPLRNWSGPGVVVHVEPRTLEGVYESILQIGEVVGAKRRAEELVAGMKHELETLRGTSPKRKFRVYLEEWFHPPMASGNWVPELADIAGGEEGLARVGESSRQYEFSELEQFDPDVMIFHWCGWGVRFDSGRVLERPGWRELRAVREKRLFALDDSLLNRPGPRLIEGARRLRGMLRNIRPFVKV